MRCSFKCPVCGLNCIEKEGHTGYHKCPVHYTERNKIFKQLEEEIKNKSL